LPGGIYSRFRIVDIRRVDDNGKYITHDVGRDMPLAPFYPA
jgi:hypothetical protein